MRHLGPAPDRVGRLEQDPQVRRDIAESTEQWRDEQDAIAREEQLAKRPDREPEFSKL